MVTSIDELGAPIATGILGLGGKWILAGQADNKSWIGDVQSSMDNRLKQVEADTRTFMFKTDLEKAFYIKRMAAPRSSRARII